MRCLTIATAVLLATAITASAGNNNNQGGNNNNQGGNNNNQGGNYYGAPGPVVGAGLPALAIGVGYGVYWLRKRRRRAD